MMRLLARAMLAVCLAVAASFNAQAQTKPKVTTLGPDFPKAVLFVGNSFFYYNNGMPGHLSFMGAGCRCGQQGGVSQHHGDDRRLRSRLARHGQSAAAGRHRRLFLR
ncbi:hypothetical protein ABIB73_000721 [Bradyrhizobium sp. F1.4.3]